MKLLIACVLLITIYQVNANEVRIYPITENEIHLHFQSKDTVASEIKSSKIGDISNDILDTIVNEISLVVGMNDVGIQHMRWEFEHTSKLGTLIIYKFEAQVNQYEVNIKSKILKLEQDIPTYYDVVHHCAKTGERRYGLFGPRSTECYDYYVERNPNAEEIAKINQKLLDKLSNTKMLGF